MSQPTKQRPPQVTLASGIVMFASVVVVLSAWQRVSTLGSLDTQQSITDFLAEPRFAALGLDAASATQLLRISCLVAAASACGTAILGWYVRKPDRAARLGLTIFAVPVFVAGFFAAGLSGSFVAAGAAMLWLVPAREWFATGMWTPPPAARDTGGSRRSLLGERGNRDTSPSAGVGGPRTPPTSTSPAPADRPFGEPRTPNEWPSQADAPGHPWQQHRAELHDRPGAMVAAFVITVVTTGGLLSLSLLWLAVAGLSPDFLRSVLEQRPDLFDEGLDLQEVRQTVFVYSSAFIVWCVLALTLAGFAMARRDWARRGLMVMAAFSAGGCVVFATTLPLVLVPAVAAVATVVCLRRVEVRRWFTPPSR